MLPFASPTPSEEVRESGWGGTTCCQKGSREQWLARAVCEQRAVLPPTVTAVAQGSPMPAQLFIWPRLPRAHLLPSKSSGSYILPQPKRAHIWHPTLPLAVSSKTTSVNTFLREHIVIPTPPPKAMKIPDARVSRPLLETSARDQSPLLVENKQGPGARGKSSTDGGIVASGNGVTKFCEMGPVNFPGNDGFPPAGSKHSFPNFQNLFSVLERVCPFQE